MDVSNVGEVKIMELYEVEATRWYFSTIYYRVVANDRHDAYQRVDKVDKGVVEYQASRIEYNGEEELLQVEEIQTVHKMYPTDDIRGEHTNCQLIGTMWNCGHIDRQYYVSEAGENKELQLPLWPLGKAWNEDTI